ncbi:MAG: hypothetical protein KBD06_03105 [Candidatus Pacebacteria bacterium]|nr:hypothetical protein [Candidatus Paceibacterota bacterium]
MVKPIEGSFEQCLGHYRKYGNDESFAKLGKIVRLPTQTPRRWFTGVIRPVGENRIRVGQALIDMGYVIREHKSMAPALQDAYALIAYGLVTLDETAPAFGLTASSARDMLLTTLLGKGGMSDERIEQGERFVVPLRSILADARPVSSPEAELPQAKRASSAPASQAERTITAPPPNTTDGHDSAAAALAAMLLSAYPLMQYMNSDDVTPEQRKKFKERFGFFGVMNISTELNRLCSEKARDQFKPEGTAK